MAQKSDRERFGGGGRGGESAELWNMDSGGGGGGGEEEWCWKRKNHSTLDHLVQFEMMIRNARVNDKHILTFIWKSLQSFN